MENLTLYNKVANVPKEAQKTITAGRIKGMTDINPMWRIKTLTEQFGVCGFGWKYVITDKRILEGADGVVCASIGIITPKMRITNDEHLINLQNLVKHYAAELSSDLGYMPHLSVMP